MSVSTLIAGQAEADAPRWRERGLVALGVAASALVLWLATGQPIAALAYAMGVGCLALALGFGLRQREPAAAAEFAPPDWSVTHAAIERGDEATAIIDRAGRLTCANARFAECFGIGAGGRREALR